MKCDLHVLGLHEAWSGVEGNFLEKLLFSNGFLPRGGGGGTRIIFWRGVRPKVWNPYPYLRIFHPQKTADFTVFFEIFVKDPFLRVFLPQKWLILHFFRNFCEMGPSSKDFFDQNGAHV